MINPYKETFSNGLRGTWSHPDPLDVIESTDFETAGQRVEGFEHTIWQIARHTMDWGWLIVHKLKKFDNKFEADDNNFFSKNDGPPSEAVWIAHQRAYRVMFEELDVILEDLDPETRFPEWDDTTAADMVMVLVSHSSYHTGQIVMLLKRLGKWKSNLTPDFQETV